MSKLLFDLFPLILFFAAFKFGDIFLATGVAIAASLAQVAWLKMRGQKVELSMLITLGVIVVFGGLTLFLRDDAFIKWKPTIVNWAFALVMLYTQFFAKKTAIEFLLGSKIALPTPVWRTMNLSWVAFFVIVGCLNLYVAFAYATHLPEEERTELWVNFKLFGIMGLTFVFMIVQMMLVSRHIEEVPDDAP